MFVTKKPWFMHVLARIDQKARIICGTGELKEHADDLRLGRLDGPVRCVIVAELDRMLREEARHYEIGSIVYLKDLLVQLKQQHWYMVKLRRMADHAKGGGTLRVVMETGEDLKLSEMTEAERGVIVAELDRMLKKEAHLYVEHAVGYLVMLREQIAELI